MYDYQDVLVGTDGSETAATAVDHAVSLADGVGDTVHVLSVANPEQNPMAFGLDSVAEVEEAAERAAEEVNDHVGVGTIRATVREGTPADEILAVADEQDVDAIVLGRSGRSNLAERITGSTTDRVVRRATRPVVLVPPTAED
jgi:nucleotide-binding universal stress UspA family protein